MNGQVGQMEEMEWTIETDDIGTWKVNGDTRILVEMSEEYRAKRQEQGGVTHELPTDADRIKALEDMVLYLMMRG